MESTSWTADRILQTSGTYWATCALHAAVELDLFSRIGDAVVTDRSWPGNLGAPVDAVVRLLDAMAAMELVRKSEEGYANTDASRTYLCTDSDHYLGYIIRHHHYLVASWARLPDAVRSGKPVRLPVREKGEREREAFLMGMFNLATRLAPRLAAAVDLNHCRRLLDLGGGPGTYAIHFCRRYERTNRDGDGSAYHPALCRAHHPQHGHGRTASISSAATYLQDDPARRFRCRLDVPHPPRRVGAGVQGHRRQGVRHASIPAAWPSFTSSF
jgi:hypothetical protein